jgi:hypothetical protein
MSLERGETQVKKKWGSLLLGICLVAAVLSVVPTQAQAAVGWTKVGTYWYYYNASGVKLTGWQTLPSRAGTDRFYLDPATSPSGQMVVSWQKIPRNTGKWYFFEPADEYGAMLVGWQYISGDWYYFDKNTATRGQMLTGGLWDIVDVGHHYWFYFIPGPTNDNGRMAMGNVTINGTLYRFGNRGGQNEGRYMPCIVAGMPYRTLNMRLNNVYTNESYSVSTAISNWNSAGAGVNISLASGADSFTTVTRGSYWDTSILGVYQRLPSTTTSFSVTLFDVNMHTAAGYMGIDYLDLFARIATHELGHALRLDDNPTPQDAGSSIMNYAPPGGRPQATPTVFDRENVMRCFA